MTPGCLPVFLIMEHCSLTPYQVRKSIEFCCDLKLNTVTHLSEFKVTVKSVSLGVKCIMQNKLNLLTTLVPSRLIHEYLPGS